MTVAELSRRLEKEPWVALSLAEWQEVEEAFQVVERHPTYLAGDLVIARGDVGLVAVERPSSRERVLRRLEADDVRRFVTDRLETYERMWDGCGCKVEYYR